MLLLEIRPGETFNAEGHHPVLAGVNDAGEAQYLTSVLHPSQFDYEQQLPTHYTAVQNGATEAMYDDAYGTLLSAERFWVLVLRFNPDPDTLEEVRRAGGLDVTGQCHWKREL